MRIAVTVVIDMTDEQLRAYAAAHGLPEPLRAKNVVDDVPAPRARRGPGLQHIRRDRRWPRRPPCRRHLETVTAVASPPRRRDLRVNRQLRAGDDRRAGRRGEPVIADCLPATGCPGFVRELGDAIGTITSRDKQPR